MRKYPKREIKRLNDLWSEYIRKRAMLRVHGCERCKSWRSSWKELQAAHCFGRANHTTAWDIENGAGLCGGCHTYIDKNEDAKFALFRELIGNSKDFEMLYFRHKLTTKQLPVDFKLVEIQLKALIKQMDVVATT